MKVKRNAFSFTTNTNTTNTTKYKGNKNKTLLPGFVNLCKFTQTELKEILPERLLEAGYTDIVVDDGYIYAKGDIPYLLTAHMDTVHKEIVKDFYEYVDGNGNHIISSPQGIGGDDRCGIYMILQIIREHKPSILFCEDEEIGGVGSKKFCKTEFINELADLKFLIELDRANGNDAVFYDCDNPEFTKFITETTGYKEAYGSFSDISTLAPACKVAAVNLSCGYYHAHTVQEEVNIEEMFNTIEVVKKLLTTECEQFEYIEVDYGFGYGNYGRSYGTYKKYDWYDGFYGKRTYDEEVVLYVTFLEGGSYKEVEKEYYGATEEEAWFEFFTANPNVCFNMVLDYNVDYL